MTEVNSKKDQPGMKVVALEYAKRGWAVFPVYTAREGRCSCGNAECKNVGKHPMTATGCKAATTDHAQIETWWDKTPEANIGIATGGISGIAVLDVDLLKGGKESLEKLVAIVGPLPDTFVSATGGGGSHYIFSMVNGHLVRNAAGYAGFKGIDIRGEGGYIVAPPSIHASGKAYAWCGGKADELAPVPAWMGDPSLLKEKTESSKKPITNTKAPSEWVVEAFQGLMEGNRNDSFTKLAGRLHHLGAHPGEIAAYLAASAEKVGTAQTELQSVIASVTKYPRTQSFQDSPLGDEMETIGPAFVETIAEFLKRLIPEQVWLIENILPVGGIGLIAGQENLGKTWLVLDLAMALASGRPWLGQHQSVKSKVMIIDEEGVPYFQQWRMRGMFDFYRLDAEKLPIDIVLNQDFRLLSPRSLARLSELLEARKPELVIIDSLVRVFGGDENSSQAISHFFRIVKRMAQKFQCAFLFTDHHRKGLPIGNSGWNQMVRGSSDKMAAVDFAFAVQKDEEHLVLWNTKARYAERQKPFKVKLVKQEDGHVIVAYEGIAADPKGIDATIGLSEILDTILPEGDVLSRQEIVLAAKDSGMSVKDVDLALGVLVQDGVLMRSHEKPAGAARGNKKFVYRRVASGSREAQP